MKRLISFCLSLGLASFFLILSAQETVNYGNVSTEDLSMTVYKNDPTASAVVLYEEAQTRYEYDQDLFFRVVTDYFVRIKILTDKGINEANGTIYTYEGSAKRYSESILGLSGCTYNLENGKIEKVKLSDKQILEEKIADNMIRTKLVFQSVKPGSVIEYKYQISSPRYDEMKDFYFQRFIPVKYSRYRLSIPEYFAFTREIKGMENVQLKQSLEGKILPLELNRLSYMANVYDYVAENLPALKQEDYVWFAGDHLTRVIFELKSFNIPGVAHREYDNSWSTAEAQLLSSDRFGKQFNYKLFTTELSTLFTPEMTKTDQVRAIYNLVRSKVAWNNKNSLWVEKPDEALKKGQGSNAEINALLICALREAGFEAYPVAIRLRNIGRLSTNRPAIDNLSCFIVAATVDDKPVYMDASNKYGDLNVMSPNCLSDYAIRLTGSSQSSVTNLTSISKNTEVTGVSAHFNKDGVLEGEVQISKSNQLAYDFRNIYDQYKNEQDYFTKKAAEEEVQIQSHEIQNLKETDKRIQLKYSFTKKEVHTGSEYIYLNPIVFPLFEETPLKAEDRNLPVEFDYPYEKRLTATIDIPDGYRVESLPLSVKVFASKNSYQYIINEDKANATIVVNIRLVMNRITYLPSEYEALHDFFMHLTASNNEQVKLKKIAP